ncbi:MAG: hypothetical protein EBZ48_01835 [Proteobacteria bacterium]|nr:hypothetical protein [Pseudomonadota bacterium]
MIEATFTPTEEPQAVDLLAIARGVSIRSKQQAKKLRETTRQELAMQGWSLRQRLQRRFAKLLSRERSKQQAVNALEVERRYQEVVSHAHRDCLEVALTVAREIVGDLLASDTDKIAARVSRGLERLSHGRVLSLEVSEGCEGAIRTALERRGHVLPIKGVGEIPTGVIRIVTAHGPVELPWEEEFDEIANQLRSVLEARIAASFQQEAA